MAMMVGNKIYCHMPKTGGAWLTSYLSRIHEARDTPGHGHNPAKDVPKRFLQGRTLFGTIRDPWSWYTSWWMHAKSVPLDKTALIRYGAGSDAFRAVLPGVLVPSEECTPPSPSVIWSLPDDREARLAFLGLGAGLYTWTFNHVFSGMVRTLIDMRQMYEGLGQVLGLEVDPKLYPPTNTRHQRADSAVDDPRTLYDQKMIDAVWEADGALIKRLGFKEPFGRAPSPVIAI